MMNWWGRGKCSSKEKVLNIHKTNASTIFISKSSCHFSGELTCTLSWSIVFDGFIADGVLDGDTSMDSSSEEGKP